MISENASPTASGLELIRAEQARQRADALATFSDVHNLKLSHEIALLLKDPQTSLLLLGMGASHHANQVAVPSYRQLGLAVQAITLDEMLSAPLPTDQNRVTFITSQSGDSGEIAPYLNSMLSQTFGLSLNPEGYLAKSIPTLLGAGGAEKAFAATRSFLLTLALHSMIQSSIKGEVASEIPIFTKDAATDNFKNVTSLIFIGSGNLYGLAEMAALGTIELGRLPALGFEVGQFRHGPPEMLSPNTGVILLKSHEPHIVIQEGYTKIKQLCDSSKSPFLALQTASDDINGVVGLCQTIQNFVIDVSASRVLHVGEPLRSSKVTR